MTEPIPTDFWGIVIPTWASAVGTIGASVVAVVALFAGRSAKRGVKNIGSGLNAEAENTAESVADDAAEVAAAEVLQDEEFTVGIPGVFSVSGVHGPRVRWQLFKQNKSKYGLLNDSATTAKVSSVKDVSDGYRDALYVLTPPPVEITPGGHLLFTIERSFASPAVTAVEVTWSEGNTGRVRRAVFYV